MKLTKKRLTGEKLHKDLKNFYMHGVATKKWNPKRWFDLRVYFNKEQYIVEKLLGKRNGVWVPRGNTLWEGKYMVETDDR